MFNQTIGYLAVTQAHRCQTQVTYLHCNNPPAILYDVMMLNYTSTWVTLKLPLIKPLLTTSYNGSNILSNSIFTSVLFLIGIYIRYSFVALIGLVSKVSQSTNKLSLSRILPQKGWILQMIHCLLFLHLPPLLVWDIYPTDKQWIFSLWYQKISWLLLQQSPNSQKIITCLAPWWQRYSMGNY